MAKLGMFFKTLGTKIATLWKTTTWFKIASIGGAIVVATSAVVIPNAIISETGGIFHKCEFSVENIDTNYLYSVANCTEKSKYYYSCACGEKGTELFEYGNALGHDLTHHDSKQVTCTDIGYDEYDTCSRCDYSTYEEISATGHTDGEWIIDKEATCTENGSKHQICSVCESTIKTETITKLGHTDGEWITDKEATVTENGLKKLICDACGAIISEEIISATGSLGISYIVNDDNTTCTINGIGTCTDTEIYINEYIDNYRVTAIGNYAFQDCEDIIVINIPSSVTSIGTRAFIGCSGLTEITIPDSVTTIGEQIFVNCTNLSTVNYNSMYSSDNNIFLNVPSIKTVVFGGESVPSYILYKCTNVENIIINESNTGIGSFVFYGCTSVASIKIPESIEYVSEAAFINCTSLQDIYIPKSINKIGDMWYFSTGGIFAGCTSIRNVYYSGTVSDWCNMSFYFAEDNPLFSGANLYINNELVVDLVIPSSVINVKNFKGCISIESVDIPDTAQSISGSAFYGCENLKTVSIGNGVSKIGYRAFYGCKNLTDIVIPRNLMEIGQEAFENCNHLSNVYFRGSESYWNAISINANNSCLINSTIHYNYVDEE